MYRSRVTPAETPERIKTSGYSSSSKGVSKEIQKTDTSSHEDSASGFRAKQHLLVKSRKVFPPKRRMIILSSVPLLKKQQSLIQHDQSKERPHMFDGSDSRGDVWYRSVMDRWILCLCFWDGQRTPEKQDVWLWKSKRTATISKDNDGNFKSKDLKSKGAYI